MTLDLVSKSRSFEAVPVDFDSKHPQKAYQDLSLGY
jgi:hypothetical protein